MNNPNNKNNKQITATIIITVLGMTLNCTEDSVSNLRLLSCYNLDNSRLQ